MNFDQQAIRDRRDAQFWQTVLRAVRVVDAQHRGPGPGMADCDAIDMVLDLIFAKAKDKHAARLATAQAPPPEVWVVIDVSGMPEEATAAYGLGPIFSADSAESALRIAVAMQRAAAAGREFEEAPCENWRSFLPTESKIVVVDPEDDEAEVDDAPDTLYLRNVELHGDKGNPPEFFFCDEEGYILTVGRRITPVRGGR